MHYVKEKVGVSSPHLKVTEHLKPYKVIKKGKSEILKNRAYSFKINQNLFFSKYYNFKFKF